MSDIAMLMTGVLMTKQPSSVDLSNLPVIQIDQNTHKFIHDQSYQLISEAKPTPPQTVWSREHSSFTPSANQPQAHKSRIKKIKQILAKDVDRLTKSYASQSFQYKSTKKQRFVAKKRKYKLIFNKFQKVSFLKQPNLATEQNSPELLVATSQSLAYLPHLQFRNSGVAVKVLQRLLAANGYSVRIDGNFGALTESAVKAFQAQHNLRVDGIVGAETWSYLTNNTQ